MENIYLVFEYFLLFYFLKSFVALEIYIYSMKDQFYKETT